MCVTYTTCKHRNKSIGFRNAQRYTADKQTYFAIIWLIFFFSDDPSRHRDRCLRAPLCRLLPTSPGPRSPDHFHTGITHLSFVSRSFPSMTKMFDARNLEPMKIIQCSELELPQYHRNLYLSRCLWLELGCDEYSVSLTSPPFSMRPIIKKLKISIWEYSLAFMRSDRQRLCQKTRFSSRDYKKLILWISEFLTPSLHFPVWMWYCPCLLCCSLSSSCIVIFAATSSFYLEQCELLFGEVF